MKTRHNVPLGNTASTQGIAPIVCPGALWVMVVSCRGGMLMLGRQAMCLALDDQDDSQTGQHDGKQCARFLMHER